MSKIVIHCASGIKNTGDEAILDVLLHAYSADHQLTVISLDAEYSAEMHKGAVFIPNNGNEWKKAVAECDLFILGGGGLIQDKTTIYNVSRWLRKLRYAQKLGKKTYVYANSLEPFCFSVNERVAAKVLKRADRVTVRDSISLEIARKMGVTKAILTADPVFGYSVDAASLSTAGAEDLPDEYIVMTVRHWYDTHPFIPVKVCSKLGLRNKKNQEKYNRYIEKLTLLADDLNEKYHVPVVWLSCCYGRDSKVAEDVLGRVKKPAMHRIVEGEYMTPLQYMAVIRDAKLLVGMRLHGFLYAFLMGTPVLMLAYQEKVRGMAALAGISEDCPNVDTFEPGQISDRAGELLADPSLQTKKTKAFAEKMRLAQKENERLARELLLEARIEKKE